MKVVIAPDSFKECLSAAEVAAAMAEGVLNACPDARVDLCPMADGGEGTVEAMVAATGGQMQTADVFGPMGRDMRARFGLLGAGEGAGLPGEVGLAGAMGRADSFDEPAARAAAVIEMAAASGLALVRPDKRDPLRTTTFGTGQLIMAALDAGARDIIVGVGGSATVDGGCGCAQALGVVFIDRDGRPCVCGLAGGGLESIADIDMSDRDQRIAEARIRVACDVTNPLTGPNGAARVYGPQKGASPETVEKLEAGLAHLADIVRLKLGVDIEQMPGAGAAGGLSAGLVAFAAATLQRGVEVVAEAVGLERRLRGADLCLTGEGKFDAQSGSGKTAFGVATIAQRLGTATICIPGQADTDAPREIFTGVRPLADGEVTVRQAMTAAKGLLTRRAAEAVRGFLGTDEA